jgi:hypothetical protein
MADRKVAGLVLGYAEPGWTRKTVDRALMAGLSPVIVLPRRNGIGPMSPIFNKGMEVLEKWPKRQFGWVWHLTNVGFDKDALDKMMELAGDEVAAVHPVFDSDHAHLDRRKVKESGPVPFIEWTAPLVSIKAWQDVGGLDNKLGYWGMDLDWSARARDYGYTLAVCKDVQLEHVYLRRKDRAEGPITGARRLMRDQSNRETEDRLIELWGEDWMRRIWPTHPKLAKRKGKAPRLYAG